jgi:alkyl hydroperoxide reductase subunit F
MMALLDLIIIGAGPAGMTAAIYARRKGLSLQLIADSVGGQVSKTGNVENYPGYESISGPQLVSYIKKQVEELKIDIRMTRVTKVEQPEGIVKVTTGDGQTYEAMALIIASGAKWRELGVPGEKEYKNKGVSYCATCDGPLFSGTDVAVIGGANSAAESVLDLANIASKVYMIIRHDIKADQVLVDRIKANGKVTVLEEHNVERINGNDFVESIDIISSKGERKKLPVSAVFVEVGLVPNDAFVKDLVKLNDKGEIIVDEYCRTNVCGIFAAGDVTSVPQKQIVIAAGEGAKAAMSVATYMCSLK